MRNPLQIFPDGICSASRTRTYIPTSSPLRAAVDARGPAVLRRHRPRREGVTQPPERVSVNHSRASGKATGLLRARLAVRKRRGLRRGRRAGAGDDRVAERPEVDAGLAAGQPGPGLHGLPAEVDRNDALLVPEFPQAREHARRVALHGAVERFAARQLRAGSCGSR